MDYKKIKDPEAVAAEGLKTEARQKEELAFAAECGLEEVQAVMARGLTGDVDTTSSENDANVKRREANIYVKVAELSKDEIKEIHLGYLHRWMEHVERNHIQHSAILRVKAELGEETSSYDSILASLDVAHELAVKKIADLEGRTAQRAQRRTAPRSKK